MCVRVEGSATQHATEIFFPTLTLPSFTDFLLRAVHSRSGCQQAQCLPRMRSRSLLCSLSDVLVSPIVGLRHGGVLGLKTGPQIARRLSNCVKRHRSRPVVQVRRNITHGHGHSMSHDLFDFSQSYASVASVFLVVVMNLRQASG